MAAWITAEVTRKTACGCFVAEWSVSSFPLLERLGRIEVSADRRSFAATALDAARADVPLGSFPTADAAARALASFAGGAR